jgi:hypothetical protein
MESTTPPTLGDTFAFWDVSDDFAIHVPDTPSEVILAYQSATNWVYYADKIVAP